MESEGSVPSEPVALCGQPYELGRSHGMQLRGQIHDFLETYLYRSDRTLSTPYKTLQEYGQRFATCMDEDYLDELQGLADGSGLGLQDILALNTFVDTCEALAGAKPTCINMVAFGPCTTGGLIHGRNTDFPSHPAHCRNATVLAFYPARGHAFLAVTWAGFAGLLTGMNAVGLTVAEVGFIGQEVQVPGVPVSLLLRRIMQYASSLEEAEAIVAGAKRTAGFNLAVTDHRLPGAIAIEFTASRCGVRPAQDGYLVVSDNRLSRVMAKRQLTEPCGVARHIRATELIEAHRGRIDPVAMRRMLADQYDVLQRAISATFNCVCSKDTVQSVVFVPERREAWVSQQQIPAPFGAWRLYRLATRPPAPA